MGSTAEDDAMSDQFSFETDDGLRLEFPIVAVNTDAADAHYEIKRVHDVYPSDSVVKKTLSRAYEYSDPTVFSEGQVVGSLTTDETGAYKGVGFNGQYDQPDNPSWETEE